MGIDQSIRRISILKRQSSWSCYRFIHYIHTILWEDEAPAAHGSGSIPLGYENSVQCCCRQLRWCSKRFAKGAPISTAENEDGNLKLFLILWSEAVDDAGGFRSGKLILYASLCHRKQLVKGSLILFPPHWWEERIVKLRCWVSCFKDLLLIALSNAWLSFSDKTRELLAAVHLSVSHLHKVVPYIYRSRSFIICVIAMFSPRIF
jgi:hypothetical protein